MVIMEMRMKNFYMFEDETIEFFYPKVLKPSLIEYENLIDFPKIRFKKVNILMGPNGSGKTRFGTLMWNILRFINNNETESLLEAVADKNKPAEFEIVFLLKEDGGYKIRRYTCVIEKTDITLLKIEDAPLIYKTHNYEKVRETFSVVAEAKSTSEVVDLLLKDDTKINWNFSFQKNNVLSKGSNSELLSLVLQMFDDSITGVKEVLDARKNVVGFEIEFMHAATETIFLQGKINDERLSSGTVEGITVVKCLLSLNNNDGIFYFDELMTRTHAEVEKAILEILIKLVNKHELCQLFFTTHTTDILELDVPIHAYTFIKHSKFIHPSHKYTRTDRNFRNVVASKIFDNLPTLEYKDDIIDVLNK